MRLRARTELFLCARKSMLKSKDQRRQRWVFNGHSMIRMHAKRIKGGLELVYRNRPYEDTRGTRSPFRAQLARNADVRYPHKRLASRSLSLSLSLCISFPRKANTGTKAKVRGGFTAGSRASFTRGLHTVAHAIRVHGYARTPRPTPRRRRATEAFARRAECLRAVRKLSGLPPSPRGEGGRRDGWLTGGNGRIED